MIVVVEGNIGAGKSTLLDAIGESIASRVGQDRVVVIKEPVGEWCRNDLLKRFYEDKASNGLQLQLTVVLSMIENERLAVNLSGQGKFVVMERSMMSAQRVFGELYKRAPLVRENDKRLLDLLNERFRPEITADRLGCEYFCRLYVRTPVVECLRRIRLRRRDGEEYITEEYLKDVETSIESLILYRGDHDTRHSIVLDGCYDVNNPMSAVVTARMQTQTLGDYLKDLCEK